MGRTNGIRIPCRTSARNTFPIPAMRLWSSKAATPHSVTRQARSALPVQWPCVPPIWLPRALRQLFCSQRRWTISAVCKSGASGAQVENANRENSYNSALRRG